MSIDFYSYVRTTLTKVGELSKGLLLATVAVLFSLTQINAQEAVDKPQDKNSEFEVYTSSVDAAAWEDPNVVKNMSFAKNDLIDAVENPNLNETVTCSQLRVTLLLDESGSILNRDGIEQVEDATLALAEVLLGTPALLSIVEFENQARTIFPPAPVDAQYLLDLAAYLSDDSLEVEIDGNLVMETYDPTLDFLNLPCPFGNTNWEAGLLEARLNAPNLLIFLTDGEPVSRVDDTNPCGFVVGGGTVPNLNAAIEVANDLREEDGVHMFGYGVGNGINVGSRLANLQLTTGEDEYLPAGGDIFVDDFSTGEFEDLAAGLSAGLNAICGIQLDINKSAEPNQICGEETVTYTISIDNLGNDNNGTLSDEAVNIVVEDLLPVGFVLDAVPAGAVFDGTTLTWNFASIAEDGNLSISYSGNFPGANGNYVNTASVDASNALEAGTEATVTKTNLIQTEFDEEACLSFDLAASNYVANPDVGQDETITESGTVLIIGTNDAGCPVEATINVLINQVADPIADNQGIICGSSFVWDKNGVEYTPENYNENNPPVVLEDENDPCSPSHVLILSFEMPMVLPGDPLPVEVCDEAPSNIIPLPGGAEYVVLSVNDDQTITTTGGTFPLAPEVALVPLEGLGQGGGCDPVAQFLFSLTDGCVSVNPVLGCTDISACNFNPNATEDDGSCLIPNDCFVCDDEELVPVDFPAVDANSINTEFTGDGYQLTWAPVLGQIGCQIQGRRVSDQALIGKNALFGESVGSLFYAGSALDIDTEYAWRVRCGCSDDPVVVGPWSPWQYFTTPSGSSIQTNPNPTDGHAVISFQVNQTAMTTLEVFDMRGTSVSQLFNQVANAEQEYRIDLSGASLPNGIYIARLVTNNEAVMHKIQIAR